MNVGDVIWEQDIYTIRFERELPAPAHIIVNGEKHPGGGKGFQFSLVKEGLPVKYYSMAVNYPYDYELIKSEVINAFKKFI